MLIGEERGILGILRGQTESALWTSGVISHARPRQTESSPELRAQVVERLVLLEGVQDLGVLAVVVPHQETLEVETLGVCDQILVSHDGDE